MEFHKIKLQHPSGEFRTRYFKDSPFLGLVLQDDLIDKWRWNYYRIVELDYDLSLGILEEGGEVKADKVRYWYNEEGLIGEFGD